MVDSKCPQCGIRYGWHLSQCPATIPETWRDLKAAIDGAGPVEAPRLTDEQIDALLNQHYGRDPVTYAQTLAFARAIEAAVLAAIAGVPERVTAAQQGGNSDDR